VAPQQILCAPTACCNSLDHLRSSLSAQPAVSSIPALQICYKHSSHIPHMQHADCARAATIARNLVARTQISYCTRICQLAVVLETHTHMFLPESQHASGEPHEFNCCCMDCTSGRCPHTPLPTHVSVYVRTKKQCSPMSYENQSSHTLVSHNPIVLATPCLCVRLCLSNSVCATPPLSTAAKYFS
jgi:hypothetical protein